MALKFNDFQCIIFSEFQFNSEQKLDNRKIWAGSNSLGGIVCEMIKLILGRLHALQKEGAEKEHFVDI